MNQKKYLSIIFVPHSAGKVKEFKVSAIYPKIAVIIGIFVIAALSVGLFMKHLINENRMLREVNSELYSQNAKQTSILEEKKREIEALKSREAKISERIREFTEKVREITDNYLAGRTESSRASRSGDRTERSFSKELSELKSILKSLNDLSSSNENVLLALADTEERLQKYLDSIPTSWPAVGKLSSRFGRRQDPINGRRRFHEGIDISAPTGTKIKSAGSGTVILAKYLSGYGRTVIIDHGNGITSRYSHASKLLVKEGQVVKKGEVIAKIGSSGRSTGPHLHFEIRLNGEPVDPIKYISVD